MRKLLVSLFCLAVTHIAAPLNAAIIFNQSYDNNRLNGGAGVNLSGDRLGTITGSSVAFGSSLSSTSSGEILSISLFGSGALNDGQQYRVTINVVENRALGTADQDPVFMLNDGTSHLSIVHGDNNAIGGFNFWEGTINSGAPDTLGIFNNLALNPAAETDVWSAQFLVGAIEAISVLSPITAGPTPPTVAFDVGQELNFAIFGGNDFENYGFDSVHIVVETIPEPGMDLLFGISVIGLIALRKRQK